jgi:apolipoprotein N-acyltransferase
MSPRADGRSRPHDRLGGPAGLGLAFLGGALAALAHPPFGVWPGIFGFALILVALDASAPRRPLLSALARGWAAGGAYLLIGTWWIAEAFFVDAAAHAWQAPLAVLFTAGGIAVFWAAAGFAYRILAPRGGWRILAFAAIWSLFEWLRGHVLTGFPWDLPGEAWRAGSAPSQAASLIGAYGLSFVTVAIGASPAVLAARGDAKVQVAPLAAAAAALALLWGFGAVRLASRPPADTALQLRVVQPGLPEEPVWTAALTQARIARFVRLTTLPAARMPQVVIWPEGALPMSIDQSLDPGGGTLPALLSATLPGQILLDGSYRVAGPPYAPRYYNSLIFLRRTDADLQVVGVYDKYRLVPFGEFLPFPQVFSLLGLTSLVQNGTGFSPGPRPAPMSVAGLPRMQPLICYESLFPGFTTSQGGRPDWIVNVSDDAWFGRTTGPLQHLNLASYRAIEEGLPMVRATPTGVSAIIDAYGRVRARLGLSQAGVIDGPLPGHLPPTLFSKVGEVPFWLMVAAGLIAGIATRRRRST